MGPLLCSRHAGSRRAASFVVSVLAAAALAAWSAAPAAAADALHTSTADGSVLRVEVGPLAPAWTAVEQAGGVRHRLTVPGFAGSGDPGAPAPPAAAGWVLVPPGTRPVLTVVAESWRDAGGRPLAVVPVPATRPGPAPGVAGRLEEVAVAPGGALPAGLAVAPAVQAALDRAATPRRGSAAELGETAWWRGRRVAPLRVVPVRHDAAGAALAVLESGVWEVRFVPDKAPVELPDAARRRQDTANDERFAPVFLNPGQLGAQPTEAAWRGVRPARGPDKARGGQKGTLLAPEIKLGVRDTRLHRVTARLLREQGLLPDTPIQESELRLYQRRYLPALDDGSGGRPYAEIEVPIHVVGGGDAFDGDDFFVFWGLRLRDDGEFTWDLGDGPVTIPGCGDTGEWANDFNVYWLAAAQPDAGEAWSRMATTTLPAAAGEPLRNYRRSEHFEEQRVLRENPPNRLNDRLYLNFHQDTDVSLGITRQWAPDPIGDSARIEAGAASFADASASVVRRVRFDLVTDLVNVHTLGTVDLREAVDRVFRWDVAAPLLAADQAKVVMAEPRGGSLYAYFNWVEISYDALYQAVDGEQFFHTGDAAGPRPIAVTGFPDADLGLVEVTDPRRPVWVALGAANVVDAGDGTFTLSIGPVQDAADSPRRFWAAADFGGEGVADFPYNDATVAADPVVPVSVSGDLDLVVVTHGVFRDGLEPWLAHRAARAGGDLAVHVVDVADLYDWYSGGLKSNWAVRRFAVHARTAWNAWALTIVGDANENQRGLLVPSGSRGWARDWVPTHYHVQSALAGISEFMATDKWYVTDETGDTDATDYFPAQIRSPWAMLTGRLPVNDPEELQRLVAKIVAAETPPIAPDWRRRALFIADDAYSNGYGADALRIVEYRSEEEAFAISERDSLAPWWASGTPAVLESEVLLLDDYLAPLYPGVDTRDIEDVRDKTESLAMPPLISALNRGALIAHYQGHANANVLASEYWLQDAQGERNRRDVSLLGNTDKPWVFFGIGCHVSDWAQSTLMNRQAYYEPSLGEKVLVWTDAGASASYGSSGYEFIGYNKAFTDRMFRLWTAAPPVVPDHGGAARSRWVLGEMLWAAEAAHLAANLGSSVTRGMVSQYVLLGDPLMTMNAGPPQVTAVLEEAGGDREVAGSVDLVATGPANRRLLRIAARDEAGVDHLRVVDSEGADLTGQAVVMADSLPPGETDHQEVHYRLEVPVRPFPHSIEVGVWDTGAPLPGDPHWTLTLEVDQEVVFATGGAPIDPQTFSFEPGVPVRFTATVSGAAWLDEGTTWALASDDLVLSDVVLPSAKDNTAELSFTATTPDSVDVERSVVLTVDGHPTTWVLQAADGIPAGGSITRVFSFPNPMTDRTRFLFETGAARGEGVVRVFSVSGRTVARLPFRFDGGGSGVVEWDGRDDEGDELANGTYLYRVEMDAPGGRVASPVQRLVVMR